MTAYRVTVAELDDLSEVTVTCPSCKTRCILPYTAPIPEQCSICKLHFDEAIRTALAAYGRFIRESKASKCGVEFSIREKSEI